MINMTRIPIIPINQPVEWKIVGFVFFLGGSGILHHFITITDTVAYCRVPFGVWVWRRLDQLTLWGLPEKSTNLWVW